MLRESSTGPHHIHEHMPAVRKGAGDTLTPAWQSRCVHTAIDASTSTCLPGLGASLLEPTAAAVCASFWSLTGKTLGHPTHTTQLHVTYPSGLKVEDATPAVDERLKHASVPLLSRNERW